MRVLESGEHGVPLMRDLQPHVIARDLEAALLEVVGHVQPYSKRLVIITSPLWGGRQNSQRSEEFFG